MNGDLPIPPPKPPADAPPPAPPVEDAGSRALEEALRSSFFIVKIIMAGLVVVFLGSGFFTVKPDEKAIVLRFGRPVGEGQNALLGPGFHWAFPKPIDEVERIPFASLQSADSSVGWYLTPEERAKGVPEPPGRPSLDPNSTSYVLTADTNIIQVRATLRYTIVDPITFHFEFADAPQFITNDLNNALLTVAGQFNVDDILTRRKTEFHDAVRRRLQELVDKQQLGVSIEPPEIQESPPLYLKDIFAGVDQALQKRGEAEQKAESYAADTLAKARGESAGRTNAAEAVRSALVRHMAAEAETFTNYLANYERDPEFFERFRVMQAWNVILTNAQEKLVQPAGTHQVRIEMSREPLAPPTPTP